MLSVRIADFSAGASGFHFPNTFRAVPVKRITIPGVGSVGLGNAANGLCGGMAFAVRDFFEFGVDPPTDTTAPAEGTPLFDYLVDRLIASFNLPSGLARYYEWMALPDEDTGAVPGVAARTRSGWSELKGVLDGGKPAPLGLIRAHSSRIADLGQNHQVVAYAYDLDEATSALTLRLYDPNHPGDEVTLACDLAANGPLNLQYETGEATRGFFLTRYERSDPRYLLDRSPRPTDIWTSLRAIFGMR